MRMAQLKAVRMRHVRLGCDVRLLWFFAGRLAAKPGGSASSVGIDRLFAKALAQSEK